MRRKTEQTRESVMAARESTADSRANRRVKTMIRTKTAKGVNVVRIEAVNVGSSATDEFMLFLSAISIRFQVSGVRCQSDSDSSE
jgi:hypothetical protein